MICLELYHGEYFLRIGKDVYLTAPITPEDFYEFFQYNPDYLLKLFEWKIKQIENMSLDYCRVADVLKEVLEDAKEG